MRVDKDGVVHFDTGGGNLGGHGDGSGEGGGYNDSGNYGSPGDADQTAVNTALMDMALASAPNFDPAGVAGLSGKSVQDAFGQALFDVLSQQDLSTVAGMKDARSTLESLSNLGYGRTTGLYANNPTMSVDQLIGANNLSNILGYVAPAIASMVPGYGAISTIGRVGSGLLSGTMTPGQALSMGLAGALGAKTGLPSGIFEGLFEGNPGKAAGAGAQGGLAALTSALTGNPYAGAIASATLGPSLGRSVSEAVGGSSTKGGGLAGMLDQGLGTSNWGGLFAGASAPSQGSAPTGNTYGDTGINPETYAVTAAIEQAAQEFKQPTREREMVAGRYGPITNYEFGA